MKRFLCILLVLSMLLIAACTAGTEQENSSTVDSSDNNVIFSYPADSSSEDEPSSSVDSYYSSIVSSEEGETSANSSDAPSEEATVEPSSQAPDSSVADSSVESAPVSQAPVISAPPISTPDVSVEPTPPNTVWVNDLKDQQDRDYHGYSAEQLDDYFDDALFVGDSVANGLKLYTSMYEKIFTDMVFHTGACYGFNNSLSAVSSKSLHPVYQGQQRTIWEMVALTGAKKVFIGFGLNDFGCVTTNNIKNCLDKIIANIRAVNPDIEIILLSSGYFTKDGESYQPSKNDYRTCFRQRDYNQFVLEYCNNLGLDYIDVSNCFADDYGYLPKEMAMDNYCHPNIKYYTAWRDILYGYAADKINGNYTNPERMR